MGLIINTTNASIGIQTTPGSFTIERSGARLELSRKRINLNLHTEKARVIIDQHEAFASAGIKSTAELIKEAAQNGYRQAMDYIAKTAEDGKSLAAIEKGGNPIAAISERDAFAHDSSPSNLGTNPKVNIDVKKGSVTFNPDPINDLDMRNTIRGEYVPGYLNINFTRSKVRIYMKQYAAISIRYQPDSKINYQI